MKHKDAFSFTLPPYNNLSASFSGRPHQNHSALRGLATRHNHISTRLLVTSELKLMLDIVDQEIMVYLFVCLFVWRSRTSVEVSWCYPTPIGPIQNNLGLTAVNRDYEPFMILNESLA
jgi:hypothetical protein